MDYGLVLAGGGMRGAYQIGVWRAIRELKINVTAIAGVSIGAINGAMLAQGDFKTAERLWRGIRQDDIIAPVKKDAAIIELWQSFLKNGIADMSPLENLLRQVINEKKLRRSAIDFGLAAFSLQEKSGIYKFKSEIPDGKLVDYLMASACVPGVKARRIDNDTFIDGGVSNNMPVNMLTARNMKNIIMVDIKGIGICADIDLSGRNVIEIVFNNPETGVAEVNAEGIDLSIQSGYIDCMRAFGRAEGTKYAFYADDYRKMRGIYSKELISSLETAAEIFEVDKHRIYTFDELTALTLKAYRKYSCEFDRKSGALDKIRRLGSKEITVYLVRNGSDNQNTGLPFFGECKSAASALIYFSGEK